MTILAVFFVLTALGLVGSISALAATTPSLGLATTYGVLASTYTDTSAATTVSGDVGFTTPPASAIAGAHTNYGSDAPYATAGIDQGNALSALALEPCTFTFAAGAIDLSTDTTHGSVGVYTPGVYCSTGAMDVGGPLTLSGSGTYIFRPVGALTSTAGAAVTLAGASACDVFWTPSSATTLAANTIFAGTIISNAGITVGANSTLNGRALAYGGTVTTDTDTISVPTCTSSLATLHVVKAVVNDNSGVATASSFNLHVKLSGTDVAGSPAAGAASPGTAYSLSAGTYTISEDTNAGYTSAFSGDCDSSGNITLSAGADKTCTITNDDIASVTSTINVVKTVINDNGGTMTVVDFPLFVNGTSVVSGATNTFSAPATYTVTETTDSRYNQTFSGDCDANGHLDIIPGDSKFCIVTNNDVAPTSGGGSGSTYIPPVPPLIDVVKVPNPLALPAGPGSVLYTYTLRNIGTVPVTNVTMVGDTCSPITLISGDTNVDAKLDVSETWLYTCTTTLSATHTNTIVATGWANGLSATDIASATVVVGVPIVPPLIHITKVPNPLTLLAGGGAVTYTKTVTNPGTVALSNVQVTDDKCSPVSYISGDTNNDLKLDTTETWTYTCRTNLMNTTTNTAVATGNANGLTARDFALATVVVAPSITALPVTTPTVPALPNTGLPLDDGSFPWGVFLGALTSTILLAMVLKKRLI